MAAYKDKVAIEKSARKINLICTSICFKNRLNNKILG